LISRPVGLSDVHVPHVELELDTQAIIPVIDRAGVIACVATDNRNFSNKFSNIIRVSHAATLNETKLSSLRPMLNFDLEVEARRSRSRPMLRNNVRSPSFSLDTSLVSKALFYFRLHPFFGRAFVKRFA